MGLVCTSCIIDKLGSAEGISSLWNDHNNVEMYVYMYGTLENLSEDESSTINHAVKTIFCIVWERERERERNLSEQNKSTKQPLTI